MAKLRIARRQDNAWLNRNRYARDADEMVRKEGSGQIDGGRLTPYVAASVPLHHADGWRFLARAFEAMSKGDLPNAIHMGYYAELRAAMSLLASEGIAVLNRKHVCIDQSKRPQVIEGPTTHQFVWAALEAWRQGPNGLSRILSCIAVHNASLAEWLQAAGIPTPVHQALVNSWLRAWSVDIGRMAEDQRIRNSATYRPWGMRATKAARCEDCVRPLASLWRSCEPGPAGSFSGLDPFLLRLALEYSWRGLRDRRPAGPEFERYVDRALQAAPGSHLRDFLLRKDTPEDSVLLREAKRKGQPNTPLPVLARATILLRLASAVAGCLLVDARFSRDDLRFWWDRFGVDHGLWDPGDDPDEFTDLWADISEALEDISNGAISREAGIAGLWRQRPRSLVLLCQAERVALWSLRLWGSAA